MHISYPPFVPTQRDKLRAEIGKFIRPEQPYALLDFPNYGNIGDSLIWLGALTQLRYLSGRHPSYTATIWEYEPAQLEQACPDGPIFLQGGGNWGDLYPGFQAFRERLLADLPHRQVIQLPQSIHFEDPVNLRRAAKVVQAHPNFTMLVRDAKAQTIANDDLGIAATLAPDCAFGLGKMERYEPIRGVLYFVREDKERVTSDGLTNGAPSTDWPEETDAQKARIMGEARTASLARLEFSRFKRRFRYYEALAKWRLERGRKTLSQGEVVVCDRLHAHILCTLLGIRHVALDNSTGKVGDYFRAWTHESDVAHYAADELSAAKELAIITSRPKLRSLSIA